MNSIHRCKFVYPPRFIRTVALVLPVLLLLVGASAPADARAASREDTNGDGQVNVMDVLRVVLTARQGIYRPGQDYNQDGAVSLTDATALSKALAAGTRTPLPAIITAPQLTSIDGATFMMGNASGELNEAPVHQVTVDAFRISRYEITNYQYAAYLNEALTVGEIAISGDTSVVAVGGVYDGLELINHTAKKAKQNECWITYSGGMFTAVAGKENWPVAFVTWHGAASFAAHYSWRLPYEAEWECAASLAGTVRYGTDTGQADSLNPNMNYNSFVGHPVAVASYGANQYALHDMSGNVYEYCQDYYGEYADSAQVNPHGPETSDVHVRRGGGWNSCSLSTMATARIAQDYPGHKGPGNGFRVADDIE